MYEELKPLHEIQLALLKELKRVCEENNLVYYLVFGTLIGAVRHQGFIPWDNDIDVGMPSADYKKLELLFKSGAFNKGFFLQTANTDPNSKMTFYKLRKDGTTGIEKQQADKDIHHGISIDIYPIYNVADGIIMREIQLIFAILYMLFCVENPPKNHGVIMKYVASIILFFVRGKFREGFREFCLSYMGKYENTRTRKKSFFACYYRLCRILYLSDAFEQTRHMKFEDEEFSVPCGYDYVLRRFYGDYMKLPPIEKRIVVDNAFEKIDVKKSYLHYKYIFYLKGQDDS